MEEPTNDERFVSALSERVDRLPDMVAAFGYKLAHVASRSDPIDWAEGFLGRFDARTNIAILTALGHWSRRADAARVSHLLLDSLKSSEESMRLGAIAGIDAGVFRDLAFALDAAGGNESEAPYIRDAALRSAKALRVDGDGSALETASRD